MNKTSIEWTDFTWNPIRARMGPRGRPGWFCTRISPGCKNCYASVLNRRFGTGNEYEVPMLAEHEFYLDRKILEQPLQRKKSAKIFLADMFDLFHEAIPTEMLDEVYTVMALAHWHTFQVLTKRASRMRQYLNPTEQNNVPGRLADRIIARREAQGDFGLVRPLANKDAGSRWYPLENVWHGVSVESQKYADERIPELMQTETALRFLSVEPMLEAIDMYRGGFSLLEPIKGPGGDYAGMDWVICGGESGPGARPFNLAWGGSLRDQCRAASVPFFMKQCGSNAMERDKQSYKFYQFSNRKGGDLAEWPEGLRVREWPEREARATEESG